MPIALKDWRQAFTFSLSWSGDPIAPVYELGNGCWAQCALCGCIHDVTSFQGQEYIPACVTEPRPYAARRAEWLKLHPDAGQHSRVWLVPVGEVTPCKGESKVNQFEAVTHPATAETCAKIEAA